LEYVKIYVDVNGSVKIMSVALTAKHNGREVASNEGQPRNEGRREEGKENDVHFTSYLGISERL
jgi:hypothetical protein